MLISFNWLKQFVSLSDSTTPQEVAEKLKLSTVEVEGIKQPGAWLNNVVVGKVLSCEKHPNADKLKVCKVNFGNETVTIVCGGSNVRESMLTAVARVGAKVKWHGAGELVELKPTTIRGVESNGMICGADEIGLAEMFPKKDEKEIVDLTSVKGAVAGSSLASVLGLNDAILEIDNKSLSNRPDLWGHYGLAREVAALFNRKVLPYKTKAISEGREIKVTIDVADQKFCSAFMAVAVANVIVGPSPQWLQARLLAVGQRPIYNIVDITNYVMFELGKPMHAFDARTLKNKKGAVEIVVRPAHEGETLKLLDEKTLQLTPDCQIVGNKETGLSLAGIMGGLESGVKDDTSTIVFETAIFDAGAIRKISTRLGVRSDSSARFEKSLDPALCLPSLERAVALVQEVCPGARVVSKVVKVGNLKGAQPMLEMPTDIFVKKLGVDIPLKNVASILERLGFEALVKKQTLLVKVPSWRATKDITIPEDIVAEVARIYGYDNIPSSLPMRSGSPPELNNLRALEHRVADVMVQELGYTEVYNYSFVSETQIKGLGEDPVKYLELDNPLSKEKTHLRRHLLENILENINHNISDRDELKLFEIGKAYHADEAGARVSEKSDELLPRQDSWFTAVYVHKKDVAPWWQARQAVETLGASLGVKLAVSTLAETRPWIHPGRGASITLGETRVGKLFELHPHIARNFGLDCRVGVVVIKLSRLAEHLAALPKGSTYHPFSLYPEVVRDIAFVVKKTVTHAEIMLALKNVSTLLTTVALFDMYEGKGVKAGYKSMAYHLTFAHHEHTLTTAEIDTAMKKVEKVLKEKCGAEVRS